MVTEKLGAAGFEARDKGHFRAKPTFDMDTIVAVMRHYPEQGDDFRLDSEKVAIIRLRLERDFGRKCNGCDLFGLGLHVDHIVPTPNDYSPANLQLLCPRCHHEVH
jgi:5-methylcytosine-specific restriction endonuclease McrA